MSFDSAKAFLSKVAADADFRAKLGACKTKEERIAMAKAAGFDFSDEDLNKAKSELTDDQLDAIAGGACCGRTNEGAGAYSCPNDVGY